MSNVLSLDSGSAQVKKVLFNTSAKRFSAAGEEKPTKIIATLPSNFLTFRFLNAPFSERRKINEIIKTELSQSLLFFDEAVWKFSNTHDKNIFVTIARKSDIEKFLKTLPEKPNILEAEPYALARLAVLSENFDSLIVDWGASKTVFCGTKDGYVNFCRVILKGGNNLTQSIAEKNAFSFEKAEALKKEKGLNLPQVVNFLEDVIELANLPLKLPYDNIKMTGGGADLPGLDKYLHNRFGLEASKLSIPGNLSNPYGAAAGAGLKDTLGDPGINLLPEAESRQKHCKKVLIAAVLILLFLSLDIKVKEIFLKKEYESLNNQMKKIVQTECPQLGKIVSPLSQFKGIVEEEKKYSLGSDLGLLNIFSKTSKDMENKGISVYEINLQPEEVNIQGNAASVKSVEEAVKSLTSDVGKTELIDAKNTSSGKVKFNLRVSLGEK